MRAFLVSANTFNGGSIHAYLVCRGPHEGHLSSVIERMQAALGKLNPGVAGAGGDAADRRLPRDRRGDRRATPAGDREEPRRATSEHARQTLRDKVGVACQRYRQSNADGVALTPSVITKGEGTGGFIHLTAQGRAQPLPMTPNLPTTGAHAGQHAAGLP